MTKKEKVSARSLILKATEGVFGTSIDFTIWFVGFSGSMMLPQRPYGAAYRAAVAGSELLEKINYRKIKIAIAEARRRGLIKETSKGKRAAPEITKMGRERLESIIPNYHRKRKWDKNVFLVTYDIPEKRREQRNLLREHAQRLGMGMLQKSVYLSIYDPRDIIQEFVKEHNLGGTIIVSAIGKDGAIGDENLEDLVIRVFKLEQLNEKYQKWMEQVAKTREASPWLVLKYLSILRKDPQLPFELLPPWWVGDKAYKLYQDLRQKNW